ncbi:MAG TPA: ABC transporter permease [Candidatus Polarisedimenticolia bacterium]|nr:ABC transporter permease [Candidatus Polarisedimenticolia bacterium]
MFDDIRYAFRTLVRQPAFSLVAILTLALGIGANTATFSVAYGALFKPLPGREPDRLYIIWEEASHYGFPNNTPAPANFVDWRARSRSFEGMAAIYTDAVNLTGSGEAEQLGGGNVTGDFFDVLGVDAALGRVLLPEDDRPEAPRVAVLSHGLWQRRFEGDPKVLGEPIVLNGLTYTIVGVLPDSFWFLSRDIDVFAPFAWGDADWANRGGHFLEVVGRLRPGVDPKTANTEMMTIGRALEQEYPESNTHLGAHIVPLRQRLFGDLRPALLALLGAVGLVLLIACVNVANLLMARASARGREIAVRRALGAGRLRLARLFLTESLILAGFGGVAGVVVSVWSVEGLKAFLPDIMAHAGAAAPMSVAWFAFALTLATGVVFGLAPVLATPREDLTRPLIESGRVAQREGGMRQGLVVAEVALCFCLLIAGGLMLRSLGRVMAQPLGFDPASTLTVRTNISPDRYRQPADRFAFYDRVLEGVRALPGVVAAGYTSHLPMSWDGDNNSYSVEGEPVAAPGQEPMTSFRVVTPGYFRAVGTPVLKGREFEPRDSEVAPDVVIINQAFADRHFPSGDVLGKRMQREARPETNRWLTIVGVVADARQSSLELPAKPEMYLPQRQYPALWVTPREMVVRVQGPDALSLAPAVREVIRSVDRQQPIVQVRTLESVIGETLTTRRLQTILFGGFAALGLALASIGLYGVLSYAVERRTREIGIRVALGAPPRRVLGMVVGSGMRLVGVGLGLGLVGAVTTARLLQSFLFGIPGTDPTSFLAGATLLLTVGLVACLIPARRAVRVDPIEALRVD